MLTQFKMGFWNSLGDRVEDVAEGTGEFLGDTAEGVGEFLGGVKDVIDYGVDEAIDRTQETIFNKNEKMGVRDYDAYERYQKELEGIKGLDTETAKMKEEFLSNQFFSNANNVDTNKYNKYIEKQNELAKQAEQEAEEQKNEENKDRIERIGKEQVRINEEKKTAFFNRLTQSSEYLKAQASGNKYIQENARVFVNNAKEKYDEMIWDGENTVGGLDRQFIDQRLKQIEDGLIAHTLSMVDYVGQGDSQDEAYKKATALHKDLTDIGVAAARDIKESQKLSVLRKDQKNFSPMMIFSALDLASQWTTNQFEKIAENFGSLEGYDENEHTATYLNQDGSNVSGFKKSVLMAGQLADEIVDGLPQLATTLITTAAGGKAVSVTGKVAAGGSKVILGKNITNKLSLIGKNYPKLMKRSGEMIEDSLYLDQAFYTLEGKSIDEDQRMEDFRLNLIINGTMSRFIKSPKILLEKLNINDPKDYINTIKTLDFNNIPQKYRDKMISADITDMRTIMYSWAHDIVTKKTVDVGGANFNGYNKAVRDLISSKRKTIINQLDGNLNMKADRLTLSRLTDAQTRIGKTTIGGKSKEWTLDTLLLKTKKTIGAYDQNLKQQVNQNILYDTGLDALYKNNLIAKNKYDSFLLDRTKASQEINEIMSSGAAEDEMIDKIEIIKKGLVIKRNGIYAESISKIPTDEAFKKVIDNGDVDFLLGHYTLIKGTGKDAEKYYFLNVLNNEKKEINDEGVKDIIDNMNDVNIDLTIGNKGRILAIDNASIVTTPDGNIDITNTFLLKADGTGSSYLENNFLISLVEDLKDNGITSAKKQNITEAASIISIHPDDLQKFKGKIKGGLNFKGGVNKNNLLAIKVLYGEQYSKKAVEFKAKVTEIKAKTKGQINKSIKKLEEQAKKSLETQKINNRESVKKMNEPVIFKDDMNKTIEEFMTDGQKEKGLFDEDFNFYSVADTERAMKEMFIEEKIELSPEDLTPVTKKPTAKAKQYKQQRLISTFIGEYQKANVDTVDITEELNKIDSSILEKINGKGREEQTRDGLVTITNNTLLKEIETVVNNHNNSDELDKVVDAATITQLIINSGGKISKETNEGFQQILNQMPSTFKQDDIVIQILNNIIKAGDVKAGHTFGKIVSGIVNDKSLTNFILNKNRCANNFFKTVLVVSMIGTTAQTKNLGILRNIVKPALEYAGEGGMREGIYNGSTTFSKVFEKYIDLTELEKSKDDLILAIKDISNRKTTDVNKIILDKFDLSKAENKIDIAKKIIDKQIDNISIPMDSSDVSVDETMEKIRELLYMRAYMTKDYDKVNIDTYISSMSELIKNNSKKDFVGGTNIKFNVNDSKIIWKDNISKKGITISIGIEKAKLKNKAKALELIFDHELRHLYIRKGQDNPYDGLDFIIRDLKSNKEYPELFKNAQEEALGYGYINNMVESGGIYNVFKETYESAITEGLDAEIIKHKLRMNIEEVVNNVLTGAKIEGTVHPEFKSLEGLIAWVETATKAQKTLSVALDIRTSKKEILKKIDRWNSGDLIKKDLTEEQVKQKDNINQTIKDALISQERKEEISEKSKELIETNKELAKEEALLTRRQKAREEIYPDGKDTSLGHYDINDIMGENQIDGKWDTFVTKLKKKGNNIIILGGDGESENYSYVTALNHGISKRAKQTGGIVEGGAHIINTREFQNIIRRAKSKTATGFEKTLYSNTKKLFDEGVVVMSDRNYDELLRKVYQEKNGVPMDEWYTNEIKRLKKLAEQNSGKEKIKLEEQIWFNELLQADLRFSRSIIVTNKDKVAIVDGLPSIYGTNPFKFDEDKFQDKQRDYTTNAIHGEVDDFMYKLDVSQETKKGTVWKNPYTVGEDIGDTTNTMLMKQFLKSIKDFYNKSINQTGQNTLLENIKDREAGVEYVYNTIKKDNGNIISLKGADDALNSLTNGRVSKINGILLDELGEEAFNNTKVDLFSLMITDQDIYKLIRDGGLEEHSDKDVKKIINNISTLSLEEKKNFKGFSGLVEIKYITAVLSSLNNLDEKAFNKIADKLYRQSWDVTKKEIVDGVHNVSILTEVMNKLYGSNKRTQDTIAKKYGEKSSKMELGRLISNFTTTIGTIEKYGRMDYSDSKDIVRIIDFDPKYIEIADNESNSGRFLASRMLEEMENLGFIDSTTDDFIIEDSTQQILEAIKEVVKDKFEEKRLVYDQDIISLIGETNPAYRTFSLVNTDILFRGVMGNSKETSTAKKVLAIFKNPTNSKKLGDYNFNSVLQSKENNRKLLIASEIDINNILNNKDLSLTYSTGKYTGRGMTTKVDNEDGSRVIKEYTGKDEQEIYDIIEIYQNRDNIERINKQKSTEMLTMNILSNGENIVNKKYTKFNEKDNPIIKDVKRRMLSWVNEETGNTLGNELSFQQVSNLFMERQIRNTTLLEDAQKIDGIVSMTIDNKQAKKVIYTMDNLGAIAWLEKKLQKKISDTEQKLIVTIKTKGLGNETSSLKTKIRKYKKSLEVFDKHKETIDIIKLFTNGDKNAFTANESSKLENRIRKGNEMLLNDLHISKSKWEKAEISPVAIYPEVIEYIDDEGLEEAVGINNIIKKDFTNKYSSGEIISREYTKDPLYLVDLDIKAGVGAGGDAMGQHIYSYAKSRDGSQLVTGPNYIMLVNVTRKNGDTAYLKYEINDDEYEYGFKLLGEEKYLKDLTINDIDNKTYKSLREFKAEKVELKKTLLNDDMPAKEYESSIKELENLAKKSDEVGC